MSEDRSQHFSGGFASQAWLTARLAEVTGLDALKREERPGTSASVMVRVDKAIGAQSTERLSLSAEPGGLALCTWPAELKDQARYTFRTDRGQRILDFAAGSPAGWIVRPNVHLAYWHARIPERVYLTCDLSLAEYVHRWLGEDFGSVGGHPRDSIRAVLWPWLLERRYADPGDEHELDEYIDRLYRGSRDAHLRPSIELRRTWSREEAVDLDHRGALVGELRSAVTEVLSMLNEPLPPASAAQRG